MLDLVGCFALEVDSFMKLQSLVVLNLAENRLQELFVLNTTKKPQNKGAKIWIYRSNHRMFSFSYWRGGSNHSQKNIKKSEYVNWIYVSLSLSIYRYSEFLLSDATPSKTAQYWPFFFKRWTQWVAWNPPRWQPASLVAGAAAACLWTFGEFGGLELPPGVFVDGGFLFNMGVCCCYRVTPMLYVWYKFIPMLLPY